MPALLGFLALVVLALFAAIEQELREQLKEASVYSVYSNEFVSWEKAPTLLRKTYEDEAMWQEKYGAGVRVVRQPIGSAKWKGGRPMPIYSQSSDKLSSEGFEAEYDFPVGKILTRDNRLPAEWIEVYVANRRLMVKSGKLPEWMEQHLSVDTALMVPDELARPVLDKGFICHISATFDDLGQVRSFLAESRAYYDADRRQVNIVSALEILESLERLTLIQKVVRSLIVIACGVILAMTLGSVAWLEYRQDSYLLALLKSFGAPTWMLLLHAFLENLLLVVIGISLVRLLWGPVLKMSAPFMRSLGFEANDVIGVPLTDFGVILLAGLFGVLLAMVPVALGLRKQPGLILQ